MNISVTVESIPIERCSLCGKRSVSVIVLRYNESMLASSLKFACGPAHAQQIADGFTAHLKREMPEVFGVKT